MTYRSGDIVEGEVTGIQPYGAFVSIDDHHTGLIHISEISEDYVREMFGIPEQFAVLSVMTFGYKDEERKPYDPEKTQWEKVHIGKW